MQPLVAKADARTIVPDRVATYGAPPEDATATLRIQGATDLEYFEGLLEAFTKVTPGLRIVYEDITTNALNEVATAQCAGLVSPADLVVSSSVDQQVKLVNDGCARPHSSPAIDLVPSWAKWREELFGLTFEPIVIVYNRALVPPDQVPRSRFDLIDLLRPEGNIFKGKVATYDIEASGVGYLLAFADSLEATTFGRLIEAFGRNDVVATCCFTEIVDGVADGRYLIAYNMFGSYALARAAGDPRIGVIAPSDYTLVLSRAAFIPKGAPNPDIAGAFLDFALSSEGRRILATSSLIVSFTEDGGGIAPSLDGSPNLRPIAFSPVLLVGLDAQKRKLFLDVWNQSIRLLRAGVPANFRPD
ncbi:MAG: ABC transporter substrate-binding protein [Rhizobiaceae bacterium]|nr:ABC transporter substrate-binding protein [Rhizobiaceae bacterium]